MSNLLKALPESCREDYQSFGELMNIPEDSKVLTLKDRLFGPIFSPETVEYAFDHHEPKENEILIASFSKTGTTWTREIVRNILYGRDKHLDLITRDLTLAQLYLEAGSKKKYNLLDNLPIPRNFYVTHLPAELVNVEKYKSKNMKFIYTMRNPKDRLVSFYHFIKNFPFPGELAKYKVDDWDDYFFQQTRGLFPTCMKEGEYYMEHILSWLPHIKDNDNSMMLVYEEMIKNPLEEVKRIAKFLEVELTEEEIRDVCSKTSFGALKESDNQSTSAESEYRKVSKLLRKGKIGEWKEYFSAEQSDYIDDEVEKKLKGTGIKFIYE